MRITAGDVISDQPGLVLPLTEKPSSSACCACSTAPSDGSDRSTPSGGQQGDRSVSRGVGYCCTVQPIDRRTTPPCGAWSPVTPRSTPVSTSAVSTPQAGGWSAVEGGSCREDEELPVLSAHNHPAAMLVSRGPTTDSDRRRRSTSRPQAPPLPPPRRTSLRGTKS